MSKPEQLSLSVALNDEARFDNFYLPQGSSLKQVVAVLQQQFVGAHEQYVYLWGNRGSGVTHLLQATCHEALALGKSVQYLPLDELKDYPPQELLIGMEQIDLVCLDNLAAVAGHKQWEKALFNLFNQMRELGHALLIGARVSAREIDVQLPDLQSRLNWGLTFYLPSLEDGDKMELLKFRAERRGMEMSDVTSRYILNHAPRQMSALIAALNCLDKQSLREQRKLTIPFVKQTLHW